MVRWIRPNTRAAVMARAARVAAQEGRGPCVYEAMGSCHGYLTLEHVVPRNHWDALHVAAERGSAVAARRLATLIERFGGKNHPSNLVVACLSHNSARQDLKLAEFAPEQCIRIITRERRAPLAA